MQVIDPAPLPVDWKHEEAAWSHYLSRAATEEFTAIGVRTRRRFPPEVDGFDYEVRPTCNEVVSPLYLRPTPIGVIAAVDDTCNEQDLAKWRRVVEISAERLNGPLTEFDWAGWIGRESLDRFDGSVTFGGMTLQQGPCYGEVNSNSAWTSFSSPRVQATSTLLIRGASLGASWELASSYAARDLYRLALVLSVLTDTTWQLKEQPTSPASGTVVPRPPVALDFDIEATVIELGGTVTWPLPLDRAWERTTHPDLIGPMSSYYRAIQLEQTDPATSLALHVAAIEGIGALVVPLSRCPCCERCSSSVGSGKRFRKALRLVRTRAEAEELERLYQPRSQVAHGGVAIGQPLTFQTIFMPAMFSAVPELQLESGIWQLHQAANDLLVRALTDPDPT